MDANGSSGGEVVVAVDRGDGGAPCDVVVRSAPTTGTVGALASALGTAALAVDGQVVDPAEPLSEVLVPGALVAPARGGRDGGGTPVVATLAVVGGPDAGRTVGLGVGGAVVGRDVDCDVVVVDPTVSHRHLVLRPEGAAVRADDERSTNGTWHGGRAVVGGERLEPPVRLRLGATDVELRPGPPPATPRVPAGPVHRPPRAPAPAAATPVALPDPPSPPPPPSPVQVVAVVAPIVLAVVMVVALGNPLYAAFALLGPVAAVGGAVEHRRRARRHVRREAARVRDEADALAALLARRGADVVAALERLVPDPAAVVVCAAGGPALWERRPADHDWLALRVGIGDLPWDHPTDGDRVGAPPAVADVLAAAGVLADAPVPVRLGGGAVLGVVGDRVAALAVARSLLVQAAVHHGPADVRVLVAAGRGRGEAWSWARWLPHAGVPGAGVAADGAAADAARALVGATEAASAARGPAAPSAPEGPTTLVVVDGDDLLRGADAPVRSVLRGGAGPVAGIVVATDATALPRSTTALLELRPDGGAALHDLTAPADPVALRPCGLGPDVAASAARRLARRSDPEVAVTGGAGLPDQVALAGLLGLDPTLPPDALAAAVAARWAAAGADPAPATPLAVGEGGAPLVVDLAAHGPHALVAGTTGAGKSELLRSLVLGLALGADPDHLTFVLVDFKGGGAFDACARLPHVVGLVTDLDEGLAERALRCLDAELRHRERLLRAAGAQDLAALRRLPPGDRGEPLPRLVVVVDEFATLKAEVPGFVDRLVGVAQRGRSLGVHLVLATQRPAGAVSEHIRTNTGLRIALRVEDPHDSTDVVDDPGAAALPRSHPGRACVRLERGRVRTVQTALATARTRTPDAAAPVVVRPLPPVPGDAPTPRSGGGRWTWGPTTTARTPDSAGSEGATDLDVLAVAAAEAWARTARPAPRRPWPDPLPDHLGVADVDARPDAALPGLVAVAVADDPDAQRQPATGWVPAAGPLLLVGTPGSGPCDALVAVALQLACRHGPDEVHLYALDHGPSADLAPLAGLPHCAGVAGPGTPERQVRVLRRLRAELDARRDAGRRGGPALVLLLDGLAGFVADHDDLTDTEVLDALTRLVADGSDVGVHVAVTSAGTGAVRRALGVTPAQRWAFEVVDGTDAAVLGLRGPRSPGVRGRGVDLAGGLELQVASVGDVAAVVEHLARRWEGRPGGPASVLDLPPLVPAADLLAAVGPPSAPAPGSPLRLPVGILDADLSVAELVLHHGDGALVAGPPRSGRSSVLGAVALAAAAVPGVAVIALAGPRSGLRAVVASAHADTAAAVAAARAARAAGERVVLLVDDAESVPDPDATLEALAADAGAGVHVVVAARADALRTAFTHWTRAVRRSRAGVLLRPDPVLDGELLGVTLPRHQRRAPRPGLGHLVADGSAALVQLARP